MGNFEKFFYLIVGIGFLGCYGLFKGCYGNDFW